MFRRSSGGCWILSKMDEFGIIGIMSVLHLQSNWVLGCHRLNRHLGCSWLGWCMIFWLKYTQQLRNKLEYLGALFAFLKTKICFATFSSHVNSYKVVCIIYTHILQDEFPNSFGHVALSNSCWRSLKWNRESLGSEDSSNCNKTNSPTRWFNPFFPQMEVAYPPEN